MRVKRWSHTDQRQNAIFLGMHGREACFIVIIVPGTVKQAVDAVQQ
jgi:hypothetical protein